MVHLSFTVTFIEGRQLIAECGVSKTSPNCKRTFVKEENKVVFEDIVCGTLASDVKILFNSTNKNVPKDYDDCAFFFSFHTSFIDPGTNSLYIPRNELDNPHKEKTWNVYNDKFAVELFFQKV